MSLLKNMVGVRTEPPCTPEIRLYNVRVYEKGMKYFERKNLQLFYKSPPHGAAAQREPGPPHS